MRSTDFIDLRERLPGIGIEKLHRRDEQSFLGVSRRGDAMPAIAQVRAMPGATRRGCDSVPIRIPIARTGTPPAGSQVLASGCAGIDAGRDGSGDPRSGVVTANRWRSLSPSHSRNGFFRRRHHAASREIPVVRRGSRPYATVAHRCGRRPRWDRGRRLRAGPARARADRLPRTGR
jgi:hypothetical protein